MAIKNLSIIGTDIDTLTAACEFALKQMSISLTTNSTQSCSKKPPMKKTPAVFP